MDYFESLVKKLEIGDYNTRANAVIGLAKTNDIRAIPIILNALGLRDADDTECKINFNSMLALAKIGENAIQPTIAALKKNPDNPDDSWRRYWTAYSLGFNRDKRSIIPLLNLLEENDLDAISGALDAIAKISHYLDLEDLKGNIVLKMEKTYHRFIKNNINDYCFSRLKELLEVFQLSISSNLTLKEAWEKWLSVNRTPIVS